MACWGGGEEEATPGGWGEQADAGVTEREASDAFFPVVTPMSQCGAGAEGVGTAVRPGQISLVVRTPGWMHMEY